jgi:hypothetical protein
MEEIKYDVFISYSHNDYVDEKKNVIPGNHISKLKGILTEAGITYWLDEEGIVPGEDYAEKILKHIKLSKIFLYISSLSANHSEWTRKEIACALKYKKHIIPFLLDDSPFDDSVMLRIVDLDSIEYYQNPKQGLKKLTNSIHALLEKERMIERQKAEDEKLKMETLERQRRDQEAERKRQDQIAQFEIEASAQESRFVELRKVVLKKEQELKMAQVDLEACEQRVKKLQKIIGHLRDSKKRNDSDAEPKRPLATEKSQSNAPLEDNSHILTIKVNESISFNMILLDVNGLSPYYIGETLVTQKLWQAVMDSNPSFFRGAHRPVENVSWDDCLLFIHQLNEKTNMNFRLPTDEEWEFAACGGLKSKGFEFAGSNNLEDVAWYDDNSGGETHPVALKRPNELGIYDMSGNVWEWCQDCNKPSQTKSIISEDDNSHFCRGGSWFHAARNCQSSNKIRKMSSCHHNYLGLRLAL